MEASVHLNPHTKSFLKTLVINMQGSWRTRRKEVATEICGKYTLHTYLFKLKILCLETGKGLFLPFSGCARAENHSGPLFAKQSPIHTNHQAPVLVLEVILKSGS